MNKAYTLIMFNNKMISDIIKHDNILDIDNTLVRTNKMKKEVCNIDNKYKYDENLKYILNKFQKTFTNDQDIIIDSADLITILYSGDLSFVLDIKPKLDNTNLIQSILSSINQINTSHTVHAVLAHFTTNSIFDLKIIDETMIKLTDSLNDGTDVIFGKKTDNNLSANEIKILVIFSCKNKI